MADAPLLRVERVVKRFGAKSGGTAAVDGVSFDLARGEFFALLGPSGCGKTTLLRLLAGFEAPDEGRILIDGADMADVPPYDRPVNMMFQSYALFPHMTAAQNIAFGLEQAKRPRAEIAARVDALLDLVQMKRLASRKPAQLSGGEKQRVALARALAPEPKLLLLDEPLTALDRKLREETRFELIRIQRRVGITFLMVTHDQEEAMTMAGRIAVMNQGRIVQMGSPRDIYEDPANRFVAGFIGAVNLFDGTVEAADGGTLLVACAEAGTVLRAAARPLAAGTAVALALRPERLVLSAAAGDLPNRLQGILRAVAYRGGASDYEVELASGKRLRVSQANAGGTASAHSPGQKVWVGFAAESAMVLDS